MIINYVCGYVIIFLTYKLCFIMLLTYKLCLFSLYDARFPEIPIFKYALTVWRLKFRLYLKSELLSLQETSHL